MFKMSIRLVIILTAIFATQQVAAQNFVFSNQAIYCDPWKNRLVQFHTWWCYSEPPGENSTENRIPLAWIKLDDSDLVSALIVGFDNSTNQYEVQHIISERFETRNYSGDSDRKAKTIKDAYENVVVKLNKLYQ